MHKYRNKYTNQTMMASHHPDPYDDWELAHWGETDEEATDYVAPMLVTEVLMDLADSPSSGDDTFSGGGGDFGGGGASGDW